MKWSNTHFRRIIFASLGFLTLVSARPASGEAGGATILERARMECRGSVAFYAKTDSSNVLLKALNYCPDGMSAKELNVAHALENEILLLLLRKGYFLESIMCGYSEETGASQRLIFLVER